MYKNFTLNFWMPFCVRKVLIVMRLTALILLLGLMQLSASTKAQRISLKETNASLERVLKEIRKQSGFDILYDLDLVTNAKPVDINVHEVNVYEALQKSLEGQSLFFSIDGNTVVIKEKSLVHKMVDVVNDHDLKIIVKDSAGKVMQGANIYIKTINRQFVTDGKGEFTVRDIPENGLVIVISFVGSMNQEVFINRETKGPYVVTLKSSTSVLEGVSVVSTGYQKLSKERAAGAYSVITQKDIESTPAVNLMERLEAKVPGVKFDIKNNVIQIRGVTNFSGGSGTPLIVVDGFPLMSSSDQARLTNLVSGNAFGNPIISSLNPADIEQITFLKDASATSIWGSRAANGVIVIDTKKGKRTSPILNLNYILGTSKNPSLSKLRWMNSAQYVDLEKEMVDKGYLIDPALASSSNAIYTPNNSEATEWMFRVKRGTATPAQRDAALAEISSREGKAQIEDYLLQNAINQQVNLTYSGGSESSTYLISGNYTRDVPIYKSNLAENAFINANTTADFFNKRITLRGLINYQFSRSKYNGAAVNALSVGTTALRPYDLVADASGNGISRTVIFRESVAAPYLAQGYLPFSYNTLDELNYSNSISSNNIFRINGGINGKITKWLNADISISSQRQVGNGNTINELNSYYSRILVNTGTVVNNGKLVYNVPYGGTYATSHQTAYDTGLRGQLNANLNLKNAHQINVIAGAEIRETGNTGSSETRYGYDIDTKTTQPVNPTTSYMTIYGYSTTLGNNLSSLVDNKKRFLSYYSNASYAYHDKYIATASLRFDDYTLLGIDRSKRARPFWSAGLRWNAEKEGFMEQVNFVDNLGLRATIGTSGVVPQGGSNITLLSVSGTDSRTGQPIATISSPGNSDLGWETTTSGNLGLDFNLFKGRLSGTFDIYNKKSKGILSFFAYNATYGWSSLQFNSGTLKGNGWEFQLNGRVLQAGRFSWNSTVNFGYTTNTVTDARYANNAGTIAGTPSTVEGMPLGSLYVYRWAGLDNKGQSKIYDRNNNIINNTTNLTAAFTKEDLKYAGTTYAPYSGGFINTFKYGRFEAGVQISAYLGHVFLKQSIENYPTFEGTYTGVLGRNVDLASRWRNPGDEATTDVPGLTGVNNNSIVRYRYSDLLVRKADNIRLQQVSLSYSFPKQYLPSKVIRSFSLSANVRNLGIIWRANKDGIDPEYINTGNYSSISPTPSYVFGLNASF